MSYSKAKDVTWRYNTVKHNYQLAGDDVQDVSSKDTSSCCHVEFRTKSESGTCSAKGRKLGSRDKIRGPPKHARTHARFHSRNFTHSLTGSRYITYMYINVNI